ncbi:MAG: tryptophan halogenase family protein [Pseudomonadota bacterium]
MQAQTKKVVIVGGGTAGWMTAAAICSAIPRQRIVVELVESSTIGIIGVGEATLPHLKRFNDNIGIDEAQFMSETSATFKLGIEFVNWGRIGDSYIHPFGGYGAPLANLDFHQLWRKYADDAQIDDIGGFSLPIVAAYQDRFEMPADDPADLRASYGYAYQLDSSKYGVFLRRHAEARGVKRTEGIVVAVDKDNANGNITSIVLDDGQRISGDLFIDCSGMRALLIGDELGVDYESWSHWLPCDRAVAVQSEKADTLPPYTRATADAAGWRWRIPLRHRTGNGHVYASAFTDDDAATDALLEHLDRPTLGDPRQLRFATGKRRVMWHNNCVAIGLSGGFLEPLESTSIYLIQIAITRLVELFPHGDNWEEEQSEYNRLLDLEFDRVRDFLILHYHATERADTPFWDYVRTMPIPDSLTEKLELFRARGRVAQYRQGLFLEPSWLAVLLGQRVLPNHYDQRVDLIDGAQLRGKLLNLKEQTQTTAAAMPDHAQFLDRFCPIKGNFAA